jgi:hypothetical protein
LFPVPCNACGQRVHAVGSFAAGLAFGIVSLVGMLVGGLVFGPVGFLVGVIVGGAVGSISFLRGSKVVTSHPVDTRRWRVGAVVMLLLWLGSHVWQYVASA